MTFSAQDSKILLKKTVANTEEKIRGLYPKENTGEKKEAEMF